MFKIKTNQQIIECSSLEELINNTNFTKQTLILIRGLPGAGKSMTAITICEKYNYSHYEADMYFQQEDKYVFDKTKIQMAHDWCYNQTVQALLNGKTVCVANTFVKKWEMEKYSIAANKFKIDLVIIECLSQYNNIHEVPSSTIERMRRQWETL